MPVLAHFSGTEGIALWGVKRTIFALYIMLARMIRGRARSLSTTAGKRPTSIATGHKTAATGCFRGRKRICIFFHPCALQSRITHASNSIIHLSVLISYHHFNGVCGKGIAVDKCFFINLTTSKTFRCFALIFASHAFIKIVFQALGCRVSPASANNRETSVLATGKKTAATG